MSNFFKKISTIITALSLCFNISGTPSFATNDSDFKNIIKNPSENLDDLKDIKKVEEVNKYTNFLSDNKTLIKPVVGILILTIICSVAWLYKKSNSGTVSPGFEVADPNTLATNKGPELVADPNTLATDKDPELVADPNTLATDKDPESDVSLKLLNCIIEKLKPYSSTESNKDKEHLEFFEDKNSFIESCDKEKKIDLSKIDESNVIFAEVKSKEGMIILGNIFYKNSQDTQKQQVPIDAVTVGIMGAGKTTFCKCATSGVFDDGYLFTDKACCYDMNFNGFKINLLDISGQMKYISISRKYFEKAIFAFCFFKDGFSKYEIESFNEMVEELINSAGKNVKCLFVKIKE